MTDKNHDKFARWLNKGIEAGFCSLPVCDTHDGLPLEEWEFAYLDEGVDLCATVVRLKGPYAPVKEDVDAVFSTVQVIPEEDIIERRPDGTFLYIEHYGDKDDE